MSCCDFKDPRDVIDQMKEFVGSGEFASLTDMVAAYISHSPKYKSQDEFGLVAGVDPKILRRIMAHATVSLEDFFKVLEQVHRDAEEACDEQEEG